MNGQVQQLWSSPTQKESRRACDAILPLVIETFHIHIYAIELIDRNEVPVGFGGIPQTPFTGPNPSFHIQENPTIDNSHGQSAT